MAQRVVRVTDAPVTIRHAGFTFEFDDSGTRQVSAAEEEALRSYDGPARLTFEDEPKKKGGK